MILDDQVFSDSCSLVYVVFQKIGLETCALICIEPVGVGMSMLGKRGSLFIQGM